MKRAILVTALGLFLGSAMTAPVMAQSVQPAITEQEAHAAGVEAPERKTICVSLAL